MLMRRQQIDPYRLPRIPGLEKAYGLAVGRAGREEISFSTRLKWSNEPD